MTNTKQTKQVHNISISVFSKPEDNIVSIEESLKSMIPFNLEEEKIPLIKKNAKGFEDRKITILDITLTKQKHIKTTLQEMLNKLTKEQKELLLRQKESRLDEDCCFFIRFDKQKWMNKKELFIVDHGDCFHWKIHLAAYPAKKENAIPVVEQIFGE